MLFQPEEKGYQDMEVESHNPSHLQQLIPFFVMKQPLHTQGEHHGPEMPGLESCHHPCRTTLAPFPNLSSAPSIKKIASSQFGANHTFNILAFYWGMYYYQFTDTRPCGSSYQEVDTVGKLPFSLEFNTRKDFLLSPLAFLLFFASLQNRMKARYNNCSLSSTCWSNFSFQFFTCPKF